MDRDTKKYELFDGNRLVYVGISNDIDRRANEHRAEGMRFTRVEQVGRKKIRVILSISTCKFYLY